VLAEKRQRILKRLKNFTKRSQAFISQQDNIDESENDEDSGSEFEEDDQPEMQQPQLPSRLEMDGQRPTEWVELGRMEVKLRIGQMHDSLENVRLALGRKAVLCRSVLRHATTTSAATRAHVLLKKVTLTIQKHVKSYHRARRAVEALDPSHSVLGQLAKLEEADLHVSADITEEQRHSQRSDKLPWIWQAPVSIIPTGRGDQEWMDECEFGALHSHLRH
jgi:hypothetical protein